MYYFKIRLPPPHPTFPQLRHIYWKGTVSACRSTVVSFSHTRGRDSTKGSASPRRRSLHKSGRCTVEKGLDLDTAFIALQGESYRTIVIHSQWTSHLARIEIIILFCGFSLTENESLFHKIRHESAVPVHSQCFYSTLQTLSKYCEKGVQYNPNLAAFPLALVGKLMPLPLSRGDYLCVYLFTLFTPSFGGVKG